MIKQAIIKLTANKDLTLTEASNLIDFLAEGQATGGQIGAFLTALKMKGETIEEITGFASRMRERALKIDTTPFENIVDSCGTGGDCSNTFNISTASAILASSSGLHVVKHSNFGFTSRCGSSNVLEALNINLVKTPADAEDALRKDNIVFIHAPYFHKSTAHVNPVRKELGIRTVFNFLGPLTNPACPTGQVLGVADPNLCPKIAEVLKNLGCKRALVVNGQNPTLDEISISGKTLVYRLDNGKIDNFYLEPEDLGIKRVKIEDIAGGEPPENAGIITDILNNKITGSRLDAVLVNTAGVLWAGYKADNLVDGIKLAGELISSGSAAKKLLSIQACCD